MSVAEPRYTVFIAAEGPSELGDLAKEPQYRSNPSREGYFQPMLRKLLGEPVAFDGQKIALLGRHGVKRRLRGHADRAAKALAIASSIEGCRVVVFAHDVDKGTGEKRSAVERRRRVKEMHKEIEEGFGAVQDAEHVQRIKATPLRMIEAWALGDREAVEAVTAMADKGSDKTAIPAHPEEVWGDESNPRGNHPKCLLKRALGRDPSHEDFAELADRAQVDTLCTTCPASFAPFAADAEHAASNLADELPG